MDVFEFFRLALDLQPPLLRVRYMSESLATQLLYLEACQELPESLRTEYWPLLEAALSSLPGDVKIGLTPHQLATLERNTPESTAKVMADHTYEMFRSDGLDGRTAVS